MATPYCPCPQMYNMSFNQRQMCVDSPVLLSHVGILIDVFLFHHHECVIGLSGVVKYIDFTHILQHNKCQTHILLNNVHQGETKNLGLVAVVGHDFELSTTLKRVSICMMLELH